MDHGSSISTDLVYMSGPGLYVRRISDIIHEKKIMGDSVVTA